MPYILILQLSLLRAKNVINSFPPISCPLFLLSFFLYINTYLLSASVGSAKYKNKGINKYIHSKYFRKCI